MDRSSLQKKCASCLLYLSIIRRHTAPTAPFCSSRSSSSNGSNRRIGWRFQRRAGEHGEKTRIYSPQRHRVHRGSEKRIFTTEHIGEHGVHLPALSSTIPGNPKFAIRNSKYPDVSPPRRGRRRVGEENFHHRAHRGHRVQMGVTDRNGW